MVAFGFEQGAFRDFSVSVESTLITNIFDDTATSLATATTHS